MQTPKNLSSSLIELSDALEHLAFAIAQQKQLDKTVHIKEFALIDQKFDKIAESLKGKESLEQQIKTKYQKGYIQNWLQQKNIYIGKSTTTLNVDKKLGDIADFLADHYFLLKDFYAQLKKHQNIRKDFASKHTSKQGIKYIRKWCNMLHKNKIIDSFNFLDQNTIDVDIAEIHKATYFINGYWLELLLRREIAQTLRKNINKIQSFDILAQVELIKPNRSSSELDLLLMINKQIYWFECKSGKIGKYYKVFNQHRKLLKLSPKNAFLVVPAFQMHQAKHAMDYSGMTTLYGTDLEEQLPKILF